MIGVQFGDLVLVQLEPAAPANNAKRVAPSADLVMYWWDRAAELVAAENGKLRRFGFVTTNSITQTFSRRVVAPAALPQLFDRPSGRFFFVRAA